MYFKRIITTNLDEDSLSIIDKKSFPEAATLYLKDLLQEEGLTRDKMGPIDLIIHKGKLLVLNSQDDTIFEIDLEAKVLKSINKLGRYPSNLGLLEGRIYIINSDSNSLTIIDSEKMELVETISLGNNPSSLALDPLNKRILITNLASSSISIIDLQGNRSDHKLRGQPLKIKLYGDHIYILSLVNDQEEARSRLLLLDRRSLEPVQSLALKGLFYDFVKIENEDRIYLICPEDGYLYRMEERSGQIKKALYIGRLPRKILYDGENHLYINDLIKNEILIVNIGKDLVEYRIKVGREPQGLILD